MTLVALSSDNDFKLQQLLPWQCVDDASSGEIDFINFLDLRYRRMLSAAAAINGRSTSDRFINNILA